MTSIRFSVIIVGILTLVWALQTRAQDGIFTGDPQQDRKMVQERFLANPEDPTQCKPERLYLEKDLETSLRTYLPSFNDQFKAFQPTSVEICRQRSNPSLYDPFLPTVALGLSTDPFLSETDIKDVACITLAQKEFGEGGEGSFNRCENGKKVSKKSLGSPCRTEKYAATVARAFNQVNECLGSNPREIFKIFTKESGMNLSAISKSGAAGISQMTQPAVLHVQDVEAGVEGSKRAADLAKEFHDKITGMSPACKPLKDLHLESASYTRAEAADDCTMLNFPGAPITQMVLGIKNYLYYKADIEATAQTEGLDKVFKKDTPEILRAVAMYSFSAAGPTSTRAVFRALGRAVKKTYKPGPQSVASFIEKMKEHLTLARPKVKDEIEGYISGKSKEGDPKGAEDKYQWIKEKLGGAECF